MKNWKVVVVPGYYLVWYNRINCMDRGMFVVVPGYYLVWYNKRDFDKFMQRS